MDVKRHNASFNASALCMLSWRSWLISGLGVSGGPNLGGSRSSCLWGSSLVGSNLLCFCSAVLESWCSIAAWLASCTAIIWQWPSHSEGKASRKAISLSAVFFWSMIDRRVRWYKYFRSVSDRVHLTALCHSCRVCPAWSCRRSLISFFQSFVAGNELPYWILDFWLCRWCRHDSSNTQMILVQKKGL